MVLFYDKIDLPAKYFVKKREKGDCFKDFLV
ncbi:hypothetical protein H702_02895 [Streptococcus equinus JB1]|uniref:Uncharacterized protein n=1 Tax=Streptococcus equinus JB1 TaxID=1294274 RepID=A0A091CBF6_STREI|nr:hypothetical protein H702_02895 [Streptococcus equinus JB1]